MTTDTIPITGLDELTAHLDDLVASPATPLQPKILDDIELQLTESNIPPLLPTLLPKLTTTSKQPPTTPPPSSPQ
ncbi:hypothetical protein CGMCC3_g12419 [Colletotrichum fructicola]|nr:uncharacterized protein CGMCC3_g12419 [Colletotrichum fructicola]KAE9571574.1 hypothetical protein CGMCC3_g12419 [Colletotrichum fructicola]